MQKRKKANAARTKTSNATIRKAITPGARAQTGTRRARAGTTRPPEIVPRERINCNKQEQTQKQQAMKFLIDLSPERGALFIENGSITGIYTDDDFLHNEQ